jgi:hypothetical protein
MKAPRIPAHWQPFISELDTLMRYTRMHPVEHIVAAAARMNHRSLHKMGNVFYHNSAVPYIQTGFIQRLTGFGWRLFDMGADVNLIRPALRCMPVSSGAVYLKISRETAKHRNVAREKVPATAYENRSFMVDLMVPAIKTVKEELVNRGVPYLEVDVESENADDSRKKISEFANKISNNSETHGFASEEEILRLPEWLA